MEFKEQESGEFGIIQKQEDGSIIQIGLTESQYRLFKLFLQGLSKDKPLIKLPNQYNLKFNEDN